MELQNPLPGRGSGYRFGIFEVDPQTPELRKGGRLIGLRPQALRILLTLLTRPGEVVSREELKKTLWDDHTFVDFDQGLNHAIRELRAALGDVADSPRFIQTLQRRGYRFVAPVEIIGQGTAAALGVAEAGQAGATAVARDHDSGSTTLETPAVDIGRDHRVGGCRGSDRVSGLPIERPVAWRAA